MLYHFGPTTSTFHVTLLKEIVEAVGLNNLIFTWVLVTNNTKQAARVSDRTAFLLQGELVEEGPTPLMFTTPKDARTGDYVEGRFG